MYLVWSEVTHCDEVWGKRSNVTYKTNRCFTETEEDAKAYIAEMEAKKGFEYHSFRYEEVSLWKR